MSSRPLLLRHSEDILTSTLFPSEPKEDLLSVYQKPSMLDNEEKRRIMAHALYTLNTDPTRVLVEQPQEKSAGQLASLQAYRKVDDLLREINRNITSPSPSPTMFDDRMSQRRTQEQMLLKLHESEKTRQHELYGAYLKNHALSDYIIQINSHTDPRVAAQQRIFDMDLLRSRVCHLLDPLCAVAVSVMKPDDFDVHVIHHYSDAVNHPRACSQSKAAFFVPLSTGHRPVDTNWPEYTESEEAPTSNISSFFNVDSDADDGKSVISDLNPFTKNYFYSSAESRRAPANQGSSEGKASTGEDGDLSQDLGIMRVLTTPVFHLNPKSLVNDHKERPMFDFAVTGIHSQSLVSKVHKNANSGCQQAFSFIAKDFWKDIENEDSSQACHPSPKSQKEAKTGKAGSAQTQHGSSFEICVNADGGDWRLSLPEKCVTRLASAGEWVKFRLSTLCEHQSCPISH